MLSLPAAPRVLICRLSAVGDTVHTLPLALAIKERWPGAFVAWVVERGASPMVAQQPAVDETIVVPKGFLESPRQWWTLRRQLRSWRFHAALDPQSLTKSAFCAWLSGAPLRIGFAPPHAREFAPWLTTHRVVASERHVVRRYLELLRPFGVEVPDAKIRFELRSDPAAAETVERFLASWNRCGEFAVINPGAGWDSKIWPCERYAAVARRLPIPSVVVWAGQRERAWAEQIVAESQGQAVLAPNTSLLELTEFVRRARLFVGSDTGPLHIAAAVETPCAAIFGPTQAEVCGPFGAMHQVLQASYDDLGSARKEKGASSDAMLKISAEAVVETCEQLLQQPQHAKQAA